MTVYRQGVGIFNTPIDPEFQVQVYRDVTLIRDIHLYCYPISLPWDCRGDSGGRYQNIFVALVRIVEDRGISHGIPCDVKSNDLDEMLTRRKVFIRPEKGKPFWGGNVDRGFPVTIIPSPSH